MTVVSVSDKIEEVSQHGTLNYASKVAECLLVPIEHAFWTMCVIL